MKPGAIALALAAFAVMVLVPTVTAQEPAEEEPAVLRLSFFMCDFGNGAGDRINEELETRDIPIWNAVVQEGMAQEHGYFFHSWADEWNLGVYTIGESIQAIIAATEEAGNRFEAQFGDEPTALEQACPHHRDGFYTMGPGTGMDEAAQAGGGR